MSPDGFFRGKAFFRVFELPLLRNAQKAPQKKNRLKKPKKNRAMYVTFVIFLHTWLTWLHIALSWVLPQTRSNMGITTLGSSAYRSKLVGHYI
jgi:hypothetical protein